MKTNFASRFLAIVLSVNGLACASRETPKTGYKVGVFVSAGTTLPSLSIGAAARGRSRVEGASYQRSMAVARAMGVSPKRLLEIERSAPERQAEFVKDFPTYVDAGGLVRFDYDAWRAHDLEISALSDAGMISSDEYWRRQLGLGYGEADERWARSIEVASLGKDGR